MQVKQKPHQKRHLEAVRFKVEHVFSELAKWKEA